MGDDLERTSSDHRRRRTAATTTFAVLADTKLQAQLAARRTRQVMLSVEQLREMLPYEFTTAATAPAWLEADGWAAKAEHNEILMAIVAAQVAKTAPPTPQRKKSIPRSSSDGSGSDVDSSSEEQEAADGRSEAAAVLHQLVTGGTVLELERALERLKLSKPKPEEVRTKLGRMVARYYRSSTSYQISEEIWCLDF